MNTTTTTTTSILAPCYMCFKKHDSDNSKPSPCKECIHLLTLNAIERPSDTEIKKRIKQLSIKKIELQAKEWFDKANGNSYFAGDIFVDGKLVYTMPFQYGYGSQYENEAMKQLKKLGYINELVKNSLWTYTLYFGIELVNSKKENCTKKELKA